MQSFKSKLLGTISQNAFLMNSREHLWSMDQTEEAQQFTDLKVVVEKPDEQ